MKRSIFGKCEVREPLLMNARETAWKSLLLPGAQFSDRFAIRTLGAALDAETAAQRALGRSPGWIRRLMAWRNVLVRPFGLKTGIGGTQTVPARIGTFPVVSRGPDHVLLGLNDKHLDFRILVDVTELGGGEQEVSALTLVETHNLLGRLYLAAVMPFHKLIVPTMLAQVSRG